VLREVQSGATRVLLLAGEAGSGKSTLLGELFRRAESANPPALCAAGECSAATGEADAYLPFRQILKLFTGDSQTSASPSTNARILSATRNLIAENWPELINAFVPGSKLIADIGMTFARDVGWVGKEKKGAAPLPTVLEQEKIFRQYTEILQTLATERTLILALDDLQWGDASSISLFFHLARQVKQAKLLLIGTYRANDMAIGRGGERHPLEPVTFELKRYYGDVIINLGAEEADERRTFVDELIDSEPNALDESFRAGLLRHTEGHPLFTVELLRDLQERGVLAHDKRGRWILAREVDWAELPPRIEGVIAERIGRLERELREILTTASVGGDDFLAQMVAKIQNIDERRLLKLLSTDLEKRHGLVLESIVQRRGRRVLAHYRFTHALVQRYLYGDLGEAEKLLLHGDVAGILEELYEGDLDSISTELAYHYDRAGDAEKALEHLEKTLERSLRVSAYREALVHANRALQLIAELPESPERTRREFALILRCTTAIKALRGWSSRDLKPHYARARELARELGDSGEMTEFLFAMWTYYLVRCDLLESRETGELCLETAGRTASVDGLVAAHTSLANSYFWLGDLEPCARHTRKVMELYGTIDAQHHLLHYGMDPRVVVNEFDVWIACIENRADDARKLWLDFLPQAEALKHPLSLAIALNTGAWMYQMIGDVACARNAADRLLALSTENGFPSYEGLGLMVRGWADSFEKPEDGVEAIERGFDQWRRTAGPLLTTYFSLLYADALKRAKREEEAAFALTYAVAFGEEQGERVFMPALERAQRELGALAL
jgi:tetratricopeptide (TPR) repeat protein